MFFKSGFRVLFFLRFRTILLNNDTFNSSKQIKTILITRKNKFIYTSNGRELKITSRCKYNTNIYKLKTKLELKEQRRRSKHDENFIIKTKLKLEGKTSCNWWASSFGWEARCLSSWLCSKERNRSYCRYFWLRLLYWLLREGKTLLKTGNKLEWRRFVNEEWFRKQMAGRIYSRGGQLILKMYFIILGNLRWPTKSSLLIVSAINGFQMTEPYLAIGQIRARKMFLSE